MDFPMGIKIGLLEFANDMKLKTFDEFSMILEEDFSNVPLKSHDNSFVEKYPIVKNMVDFFEHKTTRFPKLLKQLSIFLFLTCGLKAYQFLRTNMGLPSESSVYNYIEAEEKFIEGEIRAKQLSDFLTSRKLKRVVWLSEDATKIISKVILL